MGRINAETVVASMQDPQSIGNVRMMQKPRSSMCRHVASFTPTEYSITSASTNPSNPVPAIVFLNLESHNESLLSCERHSGTTQPTPVTHRHSDSSLSESVPLVVPIGVRKKMCGINARRIIASMAHDRVRRDRAVSRRPSKSVGGHAIKRAVPVFIQTTCPKQTIIDLEDTRPKLFCNDGVKYANGLVRHNSLSVVFSGSQSGNDRLSAATIAEMCNGIKLI